MALEIRAKKTFENNLQTLVDFLDSEWNAKVIDNLLQKLWKRIDLIARHPEIGIKSAKIRNVRSVPITKHNRLYYRVEGKYLILLLLFSNKQSQRRNRYE